MKKVDFPLVADTLFYGACTLAFSFAILRYYRIALALSVVLSLLFALSVGGLFFLFAYGRHRRAALTKAQKKEKESLMLHLALEKPEAVRILLLEAFRKDGRDAHCKEDALSLDGVYCAPLFTMQPVSADGVAHLLRTHAPVTLLCNELTAEAEQLARSFSCKIYKGDDIYALLTRTECVPEKLILGDVPRRTAKDKLRRSFRKSNARPFFVSGIALLFMSVFSLFPLYYLIAGGVLVLTAVGVRFLGYSAE